MRLMAQQIELNNNVNLAYTGPIYFGTPLQEGQNPEFVYDTGSGYLTTTSTSCYDCNSQYYDPTSSETARVVSSSTKKLEYGSASLTGYMGSDEVCLNNNTCVSDFEFFVITSQSGLNGNDGILGMSPSDKANGPSYIKALKDQGVIDKSTATFWLNYFGEQDSYVFFGETPRQYSKGEVFTQKLYERYDQWWTVKMHNVEYGGDSIKDSGIGYAILDTGTSLLYLGVEDYINFANRLLEDVPAGALNCNKNIYCYSNSHTCEELAPYMKPLTI